MKKQDLRLTGAGPTGTLSAEVLRVSMHFGRT